MKYNTKYALAAAAIAILAAACHEDDLALQQQRDGEPISLRAEINQQYATRASDGGFADGDQIGVFIVNYENDEAQPLQATGNHADNVRFTYDEATGKWTGSYQIYWKDKLTPIDAYGYYPFDADLDNVDAYPFSVQRNQRDAMTTGRKLSGYEQSDFLWAKKEGVVPTAGAITLQHRHLMAGIKVILAEGQGFDEGEWDEIDKTVLVESTVLSSTVSLQTGAVSVLSGSAAETIIPQQQDDEARAVVIPQTVAVGKTLFTLTIDGKSYTFSREEAMEYYAGKQHNFTFDVQKSAETGDYQFSLISESITPWENDPQSHDGAAREYITVHVEEGEALSEVIERMGIDPKEIVNLKLTGTLVNGQFGYIKENMPYLESLHMKDLRTKGMVEKDYLSSYGIAEVETDDWIIGLPYMYYLSNIVWPDHLVGIGGSFEGCNLRGSLIFPEGPKYITASFGGTSGFYDSQTQALSGELYIPSSVEVIGNGVFRETALSGNLVLPEHMTYIGDGAFIGCKFLTGTIMIPDGLTTLQKGTMAPNMTAKMVKIPQGVTKVNGLGGQPFSVFFPEGVTEIGSEAFWGVSSLQGDLKLPSTLRTIGGTAFAGTNISHVALPEGLEVIDNDVFNGCHYLQDTLTIPSSVVQIRRDAFRGCNMLTAIILPEHLDGIQDGAFAGCYSLDYIYSMNPEPPAITASSFDGIEKNNFTLVVPEEAVDAYRNAEHWKEFKRISAYRNFVCRPMQAKLLNKSNTRTIVLNSDGSWEVTHCPSWIHPSVTSGYKKTEMTVKIDDMAHGSPDRRDSIVFTLTDKVSEDGQPITCYYLVQQFDYEYDEDTQMELQQATEGQRGGINIVFVGDGYDAEDIARGRYLEDMKEGMEYFFAVEPYKTYQQYFNVYADVAMSYESGVCSSVNIWRETKFSTTYGAGFKTAGDVPRLSTNPNQVMDYVISEVTQSAVTADNVNQSLVICVPNDNGYEGITFLSSEVAAVAFCPHSRNAYPNDYRGIIQHEAGGHGFGKLADEYIYHRDNIWTCTCTCCSHVPNFTTDKNIRGWNRNLSLEGRYKQVDWSHLIFDPRYGDIVDIYEGGFMHGRGIYRSELNSCMNNMVPYFSTISRQAIVERIMEYAGETFDFETFVSKDSRQMGDKFLTRSGDSPQVTEAQALHNPAPVIIEGSILDYIKKGGKK